nr:SpoIIE family protein phosphatase [Pseudogemmobacter hezensis]
MVVDDSRAQRKLSAMYLRRWGYAVAEAASAPEALEICARENVDMVISDWMMPGMTGVEFCRRYREIPRDIYGYFILVTSKSDKAEVARGLEAGADDFLTKPFSSDELRARLRAGQRIQAMQAELIGKNQMVRETLEELQRLYDGLDRDLIEARKLQNTLLRERFRVFGRARVSMLIRTAGRIGGDMVGCFRLDSRRIALWSVDVSGHGVASAMMTARLAGYLSDGSPEQNIAFTRDQAGQRRIRSPAELAAEFNRLMLDELQVEQYFTLIYADFDEISGDLCFVQAGHPHPLVLRKPGATERIGDGGMPIGLVEGAEYEEVRLKLSPGDRLFLMSDGITECLGANGEELGEEGAEALLRGLLHLGSRDLLDSLVEELARFAGTDRFADDISGLVLDFQPSGSADHEDADARRLS